MNIAPLLAFTICLPAFADTIHWEFSENTAGEDLHWVSPTAVDPNADQYDYVYEITYVGVDIVILGQVIGPNDVTDQIDPELLFGTGIVDGPLLRKLSPKTNGARYRYAIPSLFSEQKN